MSENTAKKERFLLGLLGAFIGAAIGGVIWFLLYQANVVASISGFVAVFCAIKGYNLLAGKESVKGVIFSVIISVIVIVAAWYISTATDVYKGVLKLYEGANSDYAPSFVDILGSAHENFQDEEFARAAFGNLALGMLFCVIGGFSAVKDAINRAKNGGNTEIIIETAENLGGSEAPVALASAAEAPAAETPAAETPAAETSAAEAPAAETVAAPVADTVEVPSVDSIEMPTVETDTTAE